MNTNCGQQWFELAKVAIVVSGLIIVLWRYIDRTIKMAEKIPDAKSNKISARVKAAGLTAAYLFLQIPYAEKTLDVVWYGFRIDLYKPVNIIILLAAIYYGIITGGTFLTSIGKPSSSNGNQ